MWWLVWGLLDVAPLRAQMVVSDPYLSALTQQELIKLQQLQLQLAEANRAHEELLRRLGEPTLAVRSIEELSSYVTNVGRMGAPRYRGDSLAARVQPATAMSQTNNSFRTNLGRTRKVFGQEVNRDASLYEDQLRWEGVVLGSRELLETNRQHQHAMLGYLSTANNRLEKAKTFAELAAAQAEVERLRTLVVAASALAQNQSNDAQMKHWEWEIAARDVVVRRREEERMRAWSVRAARKEVVSRWREQRREGLVAGQTVQWPGRMRE